MDYLDRPKMITGVLIRGEVGVREGEVMMEAEIGAMELLEGDGSQEMQAASGSWERHKVGGSEPCHLI